ncbi:carboxypeptidase-like regulatory domain-containing protein, partial [Candidatus Uhrbacteria bacterium]|nr:carboxypeptidase-like regulatory domain-containing protein [Candidatus Uhrbacteria bacterium]
MSATPGYAGYFRDLQFTTLSLVGYASNAIRLELTGNLQRRNARLDTTVGSAPQASYVQAGIGYANIVTVSFRSSGVFDTLTRSPYDRNENIVQVHGTHAFERASFSAYVDLGALTDHRLGTSSPVRRYSMSANARPTDRQTYGATLEFSRIPDPVFGNRLDRLSGNLTASYVLGQSTLATVNAFGSRLSGSVDQSLGVIDAAVEHNFPNLHRAKVTVRRSTLSGTAPELAMAAEYSVPLAVPFGTATSVGLVDGRIVDPSGAGVPEVLVMLGRSATVTNARGGFVFADLKPDTYELTIDRGTAGLERITSVPLPQTLQIVGGERMPVVITLLPSATIEVMVERYEHGELTADGTAPLLRTP